MSRRSTHIMTLHSEPSMAEMYTLPTGYEVCVILNQMQCRTSKIRNIDIRVKIKNIIKKDKIQLFHSVHL